MLVSASSTVANAAAELGMAASSDDGATDWYASLRSSRVASLDDITILQQCVLDRRSSATGEIPRAAILSSGCNMY